MHTPSARTSLDHFAPHVSQYVEGSIMVRAVMKGFYGNTLRHPGDVFGVHAESDLAPWMELIGDEPSGDVDVPAGDPDGKADAPKAKAVKKAPAPKGKRAADADVL